MGATHAHSKWSEGEVRQVETGLWFWGLLPGGQGETAKGANGGQCQYANCVS